MQTTTISVNDLPEIFNQTSIQLAFGTPAIIEKDYWLVKILKTLYSDSIFAMHHLFKGGTSLSKCYHCIRRFSEDVDITIDRRLLGFNETDNEVSELGSKNRKRYFEELIIKTDDHVNKIANELLVKLKNTSKKENWSVYIDKNDSQRVIVEYPKLLKESFYPASAYISPRIILEFGCRGDMFPKNNREVKTYIEEVFPNIKERSPVIVNTLQAERTFWEKITLLHMLAHQSDEVSLQTHIGRHYYDIHMLYQSEIGKSAAKDIKLLETVAFHKSVFFRSKQASYETAKPGSICLLPSEKKLKEIHDDYESMSEMFFDEVVSFDVILNSIQLLQSELNN